MAGLAAPPAGLALTSPALLLTRATHEAKRTDAVHKYHVLNSLRPWWISQWYLAPAARPVDLGATVVLLSLLLLGGVSGLALGLRFSRP